MILEFFRGTDAVRERAKMGLSIDVIGLALYLDTGDVSLGYSRHGRNALAAGERKRGR